MAFETAPEGADLALELVAMRHQIDSLSHGLRLQRHPRPPEQESVTIEVGRSNRVISSGLSRALKARDGHCRWPGCERSASMCDGHHLVHWINGGPTDLDNLVLLCRRHHRMVHEGGWR